MTTITATPAQLDFNLYAGDGFAVQFTFVSKDTGAPYPLDGTFAAEIRADSTLLTSWLIDASSAAGGILRLSLDGDQTRSLLNLKAVWDLQQTSPSGNPRTWYRGQIRALEDVTLP